MKAKTPEAAAISTAIPDLTTIWTGTTAGHTKMEVFVEYNTIRYNITTQKGQGFTGQVEYIRKDGKNL